MPINVEVLTALLLEERKGLFRLLCRYLDPASAEDAYQSLYLKVSALPAGKELRDARAYLYQLAWHEAVDQTRRTASQQRLQADVAELLGDAQAPDTARIAIAQVELRTAMRALHELPPLTRRIFALSIHHGLSERAIAAMLAISRASVARHLHRASAHVGRARDGGDQEPAPPSAEPECL